MSEVWVCEFVCIHELVLGSATPRQVRLCRSGSSLGLSTSAEPPRHPPPISQSLRSSRDFISSYTCEPLGITQVVLKAYDTNSSPCYFIPNMGLKTKYRSKWNSFKSSCLFEVNFLRPITGTVVLLLFLSLFLVKDH